MITTRRANQGEKKGRPGRPTNESVARAMGIAEVLGQDDASGLTPRQRRILEFIQQAVETRGYPPSIREMGDAVGLASSSSVSHQLKVLESKGFLRRDPNRPRALEVFLPEVMAARRSIGGTDESAVDETGIGDAAPAA